MKNVLFLGCLLLSGCVTRIGIEEHSGIPKTVSPNVPATEDTSQVLPEVKEAINEAPK